MSQYIRIPDKLMLNPVDPNPVVDGLTTIDSTSNLYEVEARRADDGSVWVVYNANVGTNSQKVIRVRLTWNGSSVSATSLTLATYNATTASHASGIADGWALFSSWLSPDGRLWVSNTTWGGGKLARSGNFVGAHICRLASGLYLLGSVAGTSPGGATTFQTFNGSTFPVSTTLTGLNGYVRLVQLQENKVACIANGAAATITWNGSALSSGPQVSIPGGYVGGGSFGSASCIECLTTMYPHRVLWTNVRTASPGNMYIQYADIDSSDNWTVYGPYLIHAVYPPVKTVIAQFDSTYMFTAFSGSMFGHRLVGSTMTNSAEISQPIVPANYAIDASTFNKNVGVIVGSVSPTGFGIQVVYK